MDELSALVEIEKIKNLKARYFRALDSKDLVLLRSVFTDDIVCDFRGTATDPRTGVNALPHATTEVVQGLDAIMAMYSAAVAQFDSVHHGHMPEIELTGENAAKGIWALFDMVRFSSGPVAEITGYGHYEENYEKVGSQWKIKSLRLKRLRVDTRAA